MNADLNRSDAAEPPAQPQAQPAPQTAATPLPSQPPQSETGDLTERIARMVFPKKEAPERDLLPAAWRSPLALLWALVLPQIILLTLNLRSYGLASGEMNTGQRWGCFAFEAVQVLAIITGSIAAIAGAARGWKITRASVVPIMGTAAIYLAAFAIWGQALRPATVADWMLPMERVLYQQFTFWMLPLLFGLMQIALGRLPWKTGAIGELIALPIFVVVVAGVWFCSIWVCVAVGAFIGGGWPTAIFLTVCSIGATLLILGAVGRWIAALYHRLKGKSITSVVALGLILGVILPLCGLALNRMIPFPASFQTSTVYIWAVLNGLLLMLPEFRNPLAHRLIWLAQCASLPFTLYFFAVFLPVLPLMPLALVVAGAGFLMLVPSGLLIFHCGRIADGFRAEVRDGPKWIPAALGILAGVAIPALLVGHVYSHRDVLRSAIAYVYSPSFQSGSKFANSPKAAASALVQLRDFKAGVQLPFLGEFYSWVVFNNLVLPDQKVQEMHTVFAGQPLPAPKIEPWMFRGITGGSRNVSFAWNQQPPETARLASGTGTRFATEQIAPGIEQTRLTLDITSTDTQPAEFVTRIAVPEAAVVTGYGLRIGDKLVPGQLFDQKTALWVYGKIKTIERRDPGVLRYVAPGTLELRVFPVNPKEHRITEIQVLHPQGWAQQIALLGKNETATTHQPAPAASTNGEAVFYPSDAGAGGALILPTSASDPSRTLRRAPVYHFLVDRSVASEKSGSTETRIKAWLASHPDAAGFLVSAVNHEFTPLVSTVEQPENLGKIGIDKRFAAVKPAGGVFLRKAIGTALAAYYQETEAHPDAWLKQVPVLVFLGAGPAPDWTPDQTGFADRVPDQPDFFWVERDGTTKAFPLDSGSPSPGDRSVVLWRIGTETRAAVPSAETVWFDRCGAQTPCRFDPATGRFEMAEARVAKGTPYNKFVTAWLQYRSGILDPARNAGGLAALLKTGRDTGALLPGLAYMVVENSAQWKTLEQKQAQKLKGNDALEHEEPNTTPEPGTALLLAAGGALIAMRRRRDKA